MELVGVNKGVLDVFGKEILTTDEAGQNKRQLSYKDAMITALLNSASQGESDEEKYKKFMLAKKISASTDKLTLESPEQKMIRDSSAKAWGVWIHGMLVDFVENKK